MKKRALTLSLVLAFVLAIAVQAAPARAPRIYPGLTFSGTTATCAATVRTDQPTDTVSMTVKLWQGSTCLKTWTASGTGKAALTETETVTSGKTYKLTVDSTVNGVPQPQTSVTRTCP